MVQSNTNVSVDNDDILKLTIFDILVLLYASMNCTLIRLENRTYKRHHCAATFVFAPSDAGWCGRGDMQRELARFFKMKILQFYSFPKV